MSIQVKEFIYVPGENDAEYIRLLNKQIERQKELLNKAMAKIRETEPREGEWIQNDNGTYSCSVCHSWIPEEQHHYARFCLYCGADMRGDTE